MTRRQGGHVERSDLHQRTEPDRVALMMWAIESGSSTTTCSHGPRSDDPRLPARLRAGAATTTERVRSVDGRWGEQLECFDGGRGFSRR
jgi:hypothetical protein